MKSLIGKKYYPKDNSYCVNLTSCSNYPYQNNTEARLAGTLVGDDVKECIIVSEPFICRVKTVLNSKIKSYRMILVEYKKNTYSILFYPDCVK